MKQHSYTLALLLFSFQSYGMHNHENNRLQGKLREIESLIEAARGIAVPPFTPCQNQPARQADPFAVQPTILPPLASLELPRPPLVAPIAALCRQPAVHAAHEKEVQTPAPQQDGKSGYITSFKLESRIKKIAPKGPKSSPKRADHRGLRKPQYANSAVFSQFDPDELVWFKDSRP